MKKKLIKNKKGKAGKALLTLNVFLLKACYKAVVGDKEIAGAGEPLTIKMFIIGR